MHKILYWSCFCFFSFVSPIFFTLFYCKTQIGTPPPLPVASPLAQPGSVGGPGSVSAVGPMGPQSVGAGNAGASATSVTSSNANQQANSIPHLAAMRGSSPSPAHSRSPTPHQTPPRLAGSQTPQPHTPNAPQLAPPGSQQNHLGQGPGSNKSLQQQQQHMGPAGSTTPSHPGMASSSTPHGAQLPRTPVSETWDLDQYILFLQSLICYRHFINENIHQFLFFFMVKVVILSTVMRMCWHACFSFQILPIFIFFFPSSSLRRVHFQETVRLSRQPLSTAWILPPSSHT